MNVIQPIPWFPLIRKLPQWLGTTDRSVVDASWFHAPMFYVPLVLKRLDSFWLFRAIRPQLRKLRQKSQLDLIDAHFAYPDGAGCLKAARELGVPLAVTIRGVEEDYMRIPSIASQIVKTLRSADACICVSHSLKDLALKSGVPRDKVHVVHNAVNRKLFKPGDRLAARAAMDLDPSTRLIVSVGNLLSVKRHDVLIRAFAGLEDPSARLVIIGGEMHEPGYPGELESLCRSLGVYERVRFEGRVAEDAVANWLKAADVFALASRREGCCNAILEALACGVPVVATPVGDNPWFIRDGENGFLVAVGDSSAMTGALSSALRHPDWDAGRISKKLKVGDWDSVASATLKIFERCIEQQETRQE